MQYKHSIVWYNYIIRNKDTGRKPTTRKGKNMKQTKAQRLFHKNFAACLRYVERWGFEGIGFTGVDCEENETVPTRTCNDIQKLIDVRRKHYEACENHGITVENLETKEQALEMLQITLDNQRRNNAKFAAELKAI